MYGFKIDAYPPLVGWELSALLIKNVRSETDSF
jgi:hypothetical protein